MAAAVSLSQRWSNNDHAPNVVTNQMSPSNFVFYIVGNPGTNGVSKKNLKKVAVSKTMLANILKNMYVDPALLAELDDDQKSVLFLKMREEQLRRWKEREEHLDQNPEPVQRKKTTKRVNILLGEDGKPWTWVMDEPDPNERASIQIERLKRPTSLGLPKLNGTTDPPFSSPAKAEIPRPNSLNSINFPKESTVHPTSQTIGLEAELQKLVCDMTNFATSPVSVDKSSWLREKQSQVKARDSTQTSPDGSPTSSARHEVYRSSQGTTPDSPVIQRDWNQADEDAWRTQEKKAKLADAQRRQIARNAREEIKRTSQLIIDGASSPIGDEAAVFPDVIPTAQNARQNKEISTLLKPPILPKPAVKPPVPPKNLRVLNKGGPLLAPLQATSRSKDAKVFGRLEVETWFSEEQLQKGSLSEQSVPGEAASWFHGFLSRSDAETILETESEGSFLVRVHDRIKGYVVSYKGSDKVKHFLVDASQPSQIQFFGANQLIFTTVVDLVNFHMKNPVSFTGNEMLRVGVPLRSTPDVEDVTVRL